MDVGHFARLCGNTIYALYHGSKITSWPLVRLAQIICWSVFLMNWSTAELGPISTDSVLKLSGQYRSD